MLLRRIFKGMPDMGPWVSVAEFAAAIVTIAATLMALNVVPTPFGHVSSGTISGSIVDLATSKPVPEATVQIIDSASRLIVAESVPDAEGAWKETVKPGDYTVKATCDGYHPCQKSVTVVQDKCRVVGLCIKQRLAGEAEQAPAQRPAQAGAAGTPVTVNKTVVVHMPGGSAPAASKAAPTAASSSTASAPAAGGGAQTDKLVQQAESLYKQGKYQEAIDALAKATKLDPTDGKLYAKLVILNVECDNKADAKCWADEGKQKAKKNKDALRDAMLYLQ